MKLLKVILVVLVTLSFLFSLTTLLIVTQNSNILAPNSSTIPPPIAPTMPPDPPPPSITNPQPTPTPQPKTELTLTYTETNRVENKDKTKVTLTIDMTYNSGDTVTIDYSEFSLGIYVPRFLYFTGVGTAEPQSSGSFVLGPVHSTHTFQLTFEEFPTEAHNGMDGYGPTRYQLDYTGPATIQWTNPRAY